MQDRYTLQEPNPSSFAYEAHVSSATTEQSFLWAIEAALQLLAALPPTKRLPCFGISPRTLTEWQWSVLILRFHSSKV